MSPFCCFKYSFTQICSRYFTCVMHDQPNGSLNLMITKKSYYKFFRKLIDKLAVVGATGVIGSAQQEIWLKGTSTCT